MTREGLEPSRRGGHGLLRTACLPFHHLAIREQWTVEGVEPSSAGCKPTVFPLDDTPRTESVAPQGVEPPVSLHLREGGLPVAYRANSSAALSKSRRSPTAAGRQSARRESNPPVRFGRPVPWPLGYGHVSLSGRRGSRTLKARRSSGFGPGAVASRLALPLESGRLDSNQRGPASDAGG